MRSKRGGAYQPVNPRSKFFPNFQLALEPLRHCGSTRQTTRDQKD